MSVLNIRGVPEELTNAVRIAAIKAGISIREFVIKSLSDAVGFKAAEKLPPIINSKSEAVIEKKFRTPQRRNHKTAVSPTAKALKQKPKKEETESAPKAQFCRHQLRYCRLCPGFS